MLGSFSNRRSERSVRARASISFSETNSITSCPRARSASATAIPGKRCPPVPPHAMTAFMKISGSSRLNSRGDTDLEREPLFVCAFKIGLPVNVQQNTDAEETGHQVRSDVTYEWQRQSLVRQQRRRDADIYGGL